MNSFLARKPRRILSDRKFPKASRSLLPAIFLSLVLLSRLSAFGQAELPSQAGLVHFGDLIEVDVVGSFEHDWRGSLTPEGFLDGLISLENQIYALCRSEQDLSLAIQTELSKTLRDPKVAVRILDRSNRAVAFLNGAVKVPQRFQIKRPIYLNEMLTLSGGITDRSSGEVSVFRPANLSCTEPPKIGESEFVKASQPVGAERTIIKIVAILRGDPSANPRILSGDIVTVVEALPVYVIGGVNAPQQIPLRNELTLSRAIAMAGGLAKEANSSITVFRRGGSGTELITVDVLKIAAGQADDPVLKPFDIVDVPQKGKAVRVRPPVIDNGGSNSATLANLPLRIIE
ncbi:MAG: SLBB domain-containing protein [Blastocatellia bacterium]|nr:SLBB domain-containing protein [Blastocatellia bacterium]